MNVLLTTCGAWYLPQAAAAFHTRQSLAGLWMTHKQPANIPSALFRRCWPFHLAMKPFYQGAPQIATEKAFYAFRPLWSAWLRRQFRPLANPPRADVVQAILGYGEELFAYARTIGALKVIDCPNTHPRTFIGLWQKECDQWCPGEQVPIPASMLRRMENDLAEADLVIALSSFARETMIAHGVPAEKISVHPLGVDTTLFQPRIAPPEKIRFLSVGTICLRKGHQYLFRAFARVREKFPEAELVCIGEYKSDFRKERPRWEGTFTHIPHCPHPELAGQLTNATAFVLPSLEEGFARVLGEAMSAGVPVIATHPSGASTVMTHGVEGLLVPTSNVEQLAEAMLQLAVQREQNARMGAAAAALARQRLSWQDYGDGLLAEFERRLAQRRSA